MPHRLPDGFNRWLAAGFAAIWVLAHLHAPLVEDTLFWWVPKGLLVAETGPHLVLANTLPEAITGHGAPLPPQWAGGLPDYGHPPLWYWWLGLFLRLAPRVETVHLAALLPAVAAAVGFVVLGERLGSRWSGLAALCLPPVLAQLVRADLDLPLLAVMPWALVALVDRRWWAFAALGALAPWLKEPGVLLVVPAIWMAWRERRWRWQALVPLVALGAWAVLHGGLARPERLPLTFSQYAIDLVVATRIVFFEQGRWALLAGLPWLPRTLSRPAGQVGGALVVTWVAFFAAVGFFATRGTLLPLTHVRYFLPGMAVGAVLLASRWPWLALVGLLWLRARSPFGPEASMYGIDAALAEREAAPWIAGQAAAGVETWVGSYQAAGLTQPWVGIVAQPVRPLHIYAQDTDPTAIDPGSLLLVAAYGEPAGVYERALILEEAARWRRGQAEVVAWTVTAHRR